ncbi:hypothetical protein ARMGADRAFT_988369 [Armillaria gallica]|uniref:Uncharacterized protein n=1 Tax=Armillaria gallica TaxID=47427 RepID=A0A2H3DRK3_ARMGA|nr:hypothetical protein ARMGADRAFT_988369 [Armillaria gallica]
MLLFLPRYYMMVSHDYKRQFTASEALKFFEDIYPLLTESNCRPSRRYHETFDRWKDLSPDLTKQWASYREPPLPRSTKILRYLCKYRRIRRAIVWIREMYASYFGRCSILASYL